MLMVDMRNSTARIGLHEIAAGGRRFVSNPAAFAGFVAGVRLTPDALSGAEWRNPASAAGRFSFFRTLMHESLPRFYDVTHLEELGGRFALRLLGAGRYGNYTVTALNRRVLTFSGLPVDEKGEAVIDASVRADVFLALWNDMLAGLAETTLARIDAARAAVRPAA